LIIGRLDAKTVALGVVLVDLEFFLVDNKCQKGFLLAGDINVVGDNYLHGR